MARGPKRAPREVKLGLFGREGVQEYGGREKGRRSDTLKVEI